MRYWVCILCLVFPLIITAQKSKNIDLVSRVKTDITANDVWGFKHSNGIEYAIMGDNNSTHIFSLEDPQNPTQVADVPGAISTWRDIKNFNDIVYVVADRGADGLLVIDMSNLEDSVSHKFINLDIQVGQIPDQVRTCHNLYIDRDQGYLYLAGCNVSAGGVIILDLNGDPLNPEYVGIANLNYAHDVYVRDNLMFSSEIYLGQMAIYDVTDKSQPDLLGTINTPNNFTHNIWSSDDNKYAYTTDERQESFVGAYDISDPSNIKYLDKFKPVEGKEAIPHNTHFYDDYLYTSWYTEGVRVIDASRPSNLVEVGYYDTYAVEGGGFNGCWGAYPFLPSGLLLASDRSNGLIVLQPNLPRATYLEGNISEIDDNGVAQPLNGVTISIESFDQYGTVTDPNGDYKTGLCTAGDHRIIIKHPEYIEVDTTLSFTEGELTSFDIELVKKSVYVFQVSVEETNESPIAETQIQLVNDELTYTLNSLEDGLAVGDIIEGEYQLYAGKWGWKQVSTGQIVIDNVKAITVVLEPSYEDDFLFDLGWKTESNASAGEWVRAKPVGTLFGNKKSNVDFDIPDDLGESCYVTGNVGGQAGTDDVDNGLTSLTSPLIDITELLEPRLDYYRWFYNDGGENLDPNDTLKTILFTQDTSIVLDIVTTNGQQGEWVSTKIPLGDFKDYGPFQIRFEVEDDSEIGHILEAGIDVFRVLDAALINNEELEKVVYFEAFPNPMFDQLNIYTEVNRGEARIRVYDIKGRLVLKDSMIGTSKSLDVSQLQTGVYFMHLAGDGYQQSVKLVKPLN